jgi:hypothetical protein
VQCGGDPFWEIDRPLTYTLTNGMPSRVPFSSDEALMPIRPDGTESDATPERADFEATV